MEWFARPDSPVVDDEEVTEPAPPEPETGDAGGVESDSDAETETNDVETSTGDGRTSPISYNAYYDIINEVKLLSRRPSIGLGGMMYCHGQCRKVTFHQLWETKIDDAGWVVSTCSVCEHSDPMCTTKTYFRQKEVDVDLARALARVV